MRLPNKIFTYEQSIFPLLAPLVRHLNSGRQPVAALFAALKADFPDLSVQDFTDAISVLYVLDCIDHDNGEVIAHAH